MKKRDIYPIIINYHKIILSDFKRFNYLIDSIIFLQPIYPILLHLF
jgi:hypothetical protein